ncbi:hypothetical protein CEE59_11385, partial [Stenotrophomonas maltophilia]
WGRPVCAAAAPPPPPWRVLRGAPPPPTPPCHPTDSRLLLLLRLRLRQVQGAALPNPLTAPNARSGRNRAG